MVSVSIIIPTYKRPNLLKEALESVLNQTYKEIKEIIVTDDEIGPNETERMIKEYKKMDKRIIYLKNTKYLSGPTGNKNNGLDCATGDFIAFLDDDDLLLPDAISKLMNVYFEKGYKIIFANCKRASDGKLAGKSYGKNEEVKYEDMISGKYEGDYFRITARELLKNKRFFEETWGGEHLLWWQCWREAKVGFYLDDVVMIYRDNLSYVSKKYFQYPKRTFLNYKLTLDIFGEDLIWLSPKNFSKISLLASLFAKYSGNIKASLKYWLNSLKGKNMFFEKIFIFFLIFLPSQFVKLIHNFYRKFLK